MDFGTSDIQFYMVPKGVSLSEKRPAKEDSVIAQSRVPPRFHAHQLQAALGGLQIFVIFHELDLWRGKITHRFCFLSNFVSG